MQLARILPIVKNDPYNATNLARYADAIARGAVVQEFMEAGFDADFSFDLPPQQSLTSRTSPVALDATGKVITFYNNTAGKYMRVDAGQNGLITSTPDAREMTYAMLANYRPADPATAVRVLASTATATTADGGEELTIATNGNIQLQPRGYSGPAQIQQSALIAAGVNLASVNRFLFIAVTSRLTGNGEETTHSLFIGAPTPLVSTVSGVKVIGDRRFAIGNGYRTDAARMSMASMFGRFLAGSGPRSVAQLSEMYQRARVIAARRGITVL